jgi:hypothetical protein
MDAEEKILQLFEQYFATATDEEIKADVDYINGLGNAGIAFEDYLDTLNHATAYSLIETGLCDDIAYADLFNNTISQVEMDNFNTITVLDSFVQISFEFLYSKETVCESNYALAA